MLRRQLEKNRWYQPWIQANYEVCLLEEKLEKTDCDRRNEKSRTFSRAPAGLHLSFKKIYSIKEHKFQFRSSSELVIHITDFPVLFFCPVFYPPMEIPGGKLSGVYSFRSGAFLFPKFSFHWESGTGISPVLQLKGWKFLKEGENFGSLWISFQGLGLESALMDVCPLTLIHCHCCHLWVVCYCPHCIKAILSVHLCRPFHLSGRRHKSSCRKIRDVTSTRKFLIWEAAKLYWTKSPLNQSGTMSFSDLQKYAGIQGKQTGICQFCLWVQHTY